MRFWHQLSIATKLPLAIAALVLAVLIGLSFTAYLEVRRAVDAAATERLPSLTRPLADMLSQAVQERLIFLDSIATALRLAEHSAGPAVELDAARSPLASIVNGNDEVIAMQVWGLGARPLLDMRRTDRAPGQAGNEAVPLVSSEEARRLIRQAEGRGAFVGRFQIAQGRVIYPVVVPLTRSDGVRTGYLVEIHRGPTAEALAQLTEIAGSGTRLLFGGQPPDEWTDLARRTAPPPVDIEVATVQRYSRAGDDVVAYALPVRGSEWLMGVEFPTRIVHAPARRFLARAAVLSLFFATLGGFGGWIASRRLTRPLLELTRGVEAVAAGDAPGELRIARQDEIGRLAAAFTTMADEVAKSQHALETRVQERTAALQAANAELESFSYSVSHDMRAPLRAIDGFTRILMEDHAAKLSPDAQRCLEVIGRNSRQMGVLIDDLLAFSRIARQEVSIATVDMAGLASNVADELRASEAHRRIEIRIDTLPPAQGERAMLRQVFVNLIGNAIKFTRPRDVARIAVGARRDNGDVVYHVKDNGVGFDMQYAEKLFGVFQRLHRAEEFEGTGVGLAIVHRIVHRHGGRIWVESEPDRGTTFYFTLT